MGSGHGGGDIGILATASVKGKACQQDEVESLHNPMNPGSKKNTNSNIRDNWIDDDRRVATNGNPAISRIMRLSRPEALRPRLTTGLLKTQV
jgi:hypothetical protein